MRILHLSTYDSGGGAAKAAYRLHHILLDMGQDSLMLVQQKRSHEAEIHRIPKGFPRIAMMLSQRMEVWQQAGQSRDFLDLAWWPNGLAQHINALKPDIVNLHWVSRGFLPIPALAHIRAALVWTLHDMAAFTGGCHYSAGCQRYEQSCGNCPLLIKPSENDLSRQTWERKSSWHDLKIQLVSPSHWLADCARKSSLFAQQPIQVIHNGIDLNLFRPQSSKIREKLGIPMDKHLILFGAFKSTEDKRKGIDYLLAALPKLNHLNAACIIFGADAPENPPALGLPLYYTGFIENEQAMAELYAMADVFIAPSLEDNLPNTVVESLACGTPVVAFNATGMPSMIEHRFNGYLAKPYEAEDLALGISWLLEDSERLSQLSTNARTTALNKFDEQQMAANYAALYSSLYQSQ
jgi:glycosyltransferase involved in cell wall biosynthesis